MCQHCRGKPTRALGLMLRTGAVPPGRNGARSRPPNAPSLSALAAGSLPSRWSVLGFLESIHQDCWESKHERGNLFRLKLTLIAYEAMLALPACLSLVTRDAMQALVIK